MKTRYILIVILVLASILRLSVLGQESFWYDEIHSIQRAQAGPLDIISQMEFHMPLYLILLHYWMNWFTCDEFHLRLLSALFGIAAVGGIYLWGRALRLPKGACLAGTFLFAVSPHAIYYSYEVRMYSLLPLLGYLHFALTALVFSLPLAGKTGFSRFRLKLFFSRLLLIIGWLFLGILTAWTHLYSLFFFLSEFLWALMIMPRIRRLRHTRRWIDSPRFCNSLVGKPVLAVILSSAIAVYSIAPFVRWIFYNIDAQYGILHNYYKMSWSTPWDVFDRLINGPIFDVAPYGLRVISLLGFLYLVFLSLTPLKRAIRGHTLSNRETHFLVPGLMALSMIGVMVGISYWKQIILGGNRYLTIAVGPLCLAAGLGIDALWKNGRARRLLCILFVVFMGLAQFLYLHDFYLDREHPMLREAAASIIRQARPGDTMITRPSFDQAVVDFYTSSKIPWITWRRLMAMSPPPARVWIVTDKDRYIWEELALQGAGWRMVDEEVPRRYRSQIRVNCFEWGQLRCMETPGLLINREDDAQTGLNINDYVKSSRGNLSYKANSGKFAILSTTGELFVQPGVDSAQIAAMDNVDRVTLDIPVRAGFRAANAPRIDDNNRIVGVEGGNSFLNALTPGGHPVVGNSPLMVNGTSEANGDSKLEIAIGEFSLDTFRDACGVRIRSSSPQVRAEGIGEATASYQGLTVGLDSSGQYSLSADSQFGRLLQIVFNRTVRIVAAPAYYPSLAQPEIYPASGYVLGNVVSVTDSLQFHLEANQGALAVLPGINVTQPVTLSVDYRIHASASIRIALLGVNRTSDGTIQFSNGYGYTQVSGSSLAVGVPKNLAAFCLSPKGFINPVVQIVNPGNEPADITISNAAIIGASPLTDLALNPNRIVPLTPSGDFSLREEAEEKIDHNGYIEGNLDVFNDRRLPIIQGIVIASCVNCSAVPGGPGSLLFNPQPTGKALAVLEATVKKGTVTAEIQVKRIANSTGTLSLLAYSSDGEFEAGASIQAQDLPLEQWTPITCSGVCQIDETKLHIAVQVSGGDALILIDDVTVRQIVEPLIWFDRNFFD